MTMHSRRKFLQLAGTAAISASLACSGVKKRFRNVVMIIGDDHSARVLGCYGNELIRTPNLDRMASRGVRFTHAYANAPVCSASRQSLLTGRYPHAAGVTLLSTPFPEEQITVAEHLNQFGFATGYVGKMHFNNDGDHGFADNFSIKDMRSYRKEHPAQQIDGDISVRPPWRPFRDPARIWLNADMLPGSYYDKDSDGTIYAKKAIDFINKNRHVRFCLWLGFQEPHSPFNFPIEYVGKYDPQKMPLPEGSAQDDRWVPDVFRTLSKEERRGIIASYYTSVEYLDKNIGLVLNELDRLGLTEKTLVLYIGDHGYLLNDHKRFEKHMMWEPAIGAPLIIQGGDRFKSRRSDVLCEFIDLAPTIMEALGVEQMKTHQGASLLPILTGRSTRHKEYVFAEFLVDNKAMIRTEEWKYIFTTGKNDLGQGYATGFGPPGIVHRLYNVVQDPDEEKDVSAAPENRAILQKLQKMMIDHFVQTDPRAPRLPAGLSVDETLAWFCEPPEGEERIENH
ncbi:sulfatase [candidate division KSB1 bacterium]|nr:MAG: sulfatase [candidate division KSB1 bacterium]